MAFVDGGMDFGEEPVSRAEAIAEFLGLKTTEIARLVQLPAASVVWDSTMPQRVQEHLEAIGSEINRVAKVFDGDKAKTALWFQTPNPLLGEIAPVELIRMDKFDNLRKFIQSAVAPN